MTDKDKINFDQMNDDQKESFLKKNFNAECIDTLKDAGFLGNRDAFSDNAEVSEARQKQDRKEERIDALKIIALSIGGIIGALGLYYVLYSLFNFSSTYILIPISLVAALLSLLLGGLISLITGKPNQITENAFNLIAKMTSGR